MNSADFASRWKKRLVGESLYFNTLYEFVVMRHASRLAGV